MDSSACVALIGKRYQCACRQQRIAWLVGVLLVSGLIAGVAYLVVVVLAGG